MTREKELVRRILATLNRQPGVKAIKIHGSQFVERGTPDIMGVNNGTPFFIETKRHGEAVSDIQYVRLSEWEKAGARVGTAYDIDDALTIAGIK